jgi:hypothetical protein
MSGDYAVRAVQDRGWQPAVAALVAYPELLESMADSPQWIIDLGNAYIDQPAQLMATVQALRQRAYASGSLQSDAEQTVRSYGQTIAVLPAVPNVYCVRYYDPFVVYGPFWRPAYRPVYWRPWAPRPVFVTNNVYVAQRNLAAQHYHRVPESQRQPIIQSRPTGNVVVQPYHRVPEANRQPIVQSRTPAAFAGPAFHRQEQRQNSGNGQAQRQQRGNPRS